MLSNFGRKLPTKQDFLLDSVMEAAFFSQHRPLAFGNKTKEPILKRVELHEQGTLFGNKIGMEINMPHYLIHMCLLLHQVRN